jgi:hypothetical protein
MRIMDDCWFVGSGICIWKVWDRPKADHTIHATCEQIASGWMEGLYYATEISHECKDSRLDMAVVYS